MQQGGPLVGPRVGAGPGFNPGPNVLQGPLAYLEKTTSNIGMSFKLNRELSLRTGAKVRLMLLRLAWQYKYIPTQHTKVFLCFMCGWRMVSVGRQAAQNTCTRAR